MSSPETQKPATSEGEVSEEEQLALNFGSSSTQATSPTREDSLRGLISEISYRVGGRREEGQAPGGYPGLPTRDLAELRRANPQAPYSRALWRVLNLYGNSFFVSGLRDQLGIDQDELERRWSAVLQCIAIANGAIDVGNSLGQALAQAQYSDLRFSKLMRAQGDELWNETRRLSQFLRAKGIVGDWSQLAELCLYQEGERAESVRRKIARHYFAALHRAESGSNT